MRRVSLKGGSRTHQLIRRALVNMNDTSNVAPIPPLSDMTLAEFRSNTSETIWNELLVLGRQPGVCNLGQGFPDYSGSRVAREAAAAAMVEPSMVRFALLMLRPTTEHSSIIDQPHLSDRLKTGHGDGRHGIDLVARYADRL